MSRGEGRRNVRLIYVCGLGNDTSRDDTLCQPHAVTFAANRGPTPASHTASQGCLCDFDED